MWKGPWGEAGGFDALEAALLTTSSPALGKQWKMDGRTAGGERQQGGHQPLPTVTCESLEAGQAAWETTAFPARGLAVPHGIHLPTGEWRENTEETQLSSWRPLSLAPRGAHSAHAELLPLVAQSSLGGPVCGPSTDPGWSHTQDTLALSFSRWL